MAGSFEPGFLERQQVGHPVIFALREIGEHKGKQDLFRQQSPQVLESLRLAAIIQSTESSNRIEGIAIPRHRLEALIARENAPANRSEQEIAGYRDVLETIHSAALDIPLRPSVLLQLHRDLYQFVAAEGGSWKATDNQITEVHPDGQRVVRFIPTEAWRVPLAMDLLHEWMGQRLEDQQIDPLLLIATYIFDFLCIHPFRDGNGRMSRLLTLLLLYQHGYEVGRYISLELIVEETKESYYEALHKSSQGWHDSSHDLSPWWEYFLGVMLRTSYERFAERVGFIATGYGAKGQAVRDAIRRVGPVFQIAEILAMCPGVSRPTINRVLGELRQTGELEPLSRGRQAKWRKLIISPESPQTGTE